MRTAAILLVLGLTALVSGVGVTTSAVQPLNSVVARQSAGKVVMPNVVGMRMDRATHKLHNVGLRVNEECSGLFGCIIKANWWICTQDPKPGRKLNRYTIVLIYGKRRGDC